MLPKNEMGKMSLRFKSYPLSWIANISSPHQHHGKASQVEYYNMKVMSNKQLPQVTVDVERDTKINK